VVGGCVFIDFADGKFNGQGRTRGMGTRYCDPATDEWVITWISTDAPGQWGEWRGSFDEDGVGDFLQESQTPNGTLHSRIRWTDLTDTSAHWEYAVSQDGQNWTTAWKMDYTKRCPGLGGRSGRRFPSSALTHPPNPPPLTSSFIRRWLGCSGKLRVSWMQG